MSQAPASLSVCARCRRCCTLTPGQEGLVFPLSAADLAAIDQAVGHEAWRTQADNSAEFVAMLGQLFPRSPQGLAKAFPPEGRHWRLAVAEGGRCLFLGDGGCQLSARLRPAHCRIFPIWRLGNNILHLDVECLAIAEASDMPALLRSLDLDVPLVKQVFAQIQGAWGLRQERVV